MIILLFRRTLLWILTVGFSAVAFVASAEDASMGVPPPRRVVHPVPIAEPPSASRQSNPWLAPIKVDFPGGTLADFAKLLEPQLVGMDRIEITRNSDAVLPPLKLHDAQPLQDVLGKMGAITKGALFFELSQSSSNGDTELVLQLSYSPQFTEEYPAQRFIREFEFPGGTVEQLAEAIRKQNLGLTNIHVTAAIAAQSIPAFKVEKVTFGQMMTIIRQISNGRCQPELNATFLELGYKPDTRDTAPTATAIYPLRELLKTYRIEDINALVQTALKMRNTRIGTEEKDPDMSLHKETSTLVVVGSADQVKVVKDVLAALGSQPREIVGPADQNDQSVDAKAPSPSPAKNAP